MLFDLRGRGRRRTVRVVYIGLALLIGVGLVGFGIGGGFGGGGILSAANENEGGTSASFANQIKKYRKLTQQQPTNAAAWEGLTKALLHEAGGAAQNGLTPRGKELFEQAAQAWGSYIALNPPKPNAELAQLMLPVYSEEGLNQPAQAVAVLQVVVSARPTSAALWAQLAEYAYRAHNTRVGDLASAKAVALAPANERVRVKNELAEVKASPTGQKVYTTTTNGKTYAVKKAPNGSYTGTEIKSTPQPAPSSTTTTAKK
jgi:cytochrome c-type biogenesis protein CcmH/NrfG